MFYSVLIRLNDFIIMQGVRTCTKLLDTICACASMVACATHERSVSRDQIRLSDMYYFSTVTSRNIHSQTVFFLICGEKRNVGSLNFDLDLCWATKNSRDPYRRVIFAYMPANLNAAATSVSVRSAQRNVTIRSPGY